MTTGSMLERELEMPLDVGLRGLAVVDTPGTCPRLDFRSCSISVSIWAVIAACFRQGKFLLVIEDIGLYRQISSSSLPLLSPVA